MADDRAQGRVVRSHAQTRTTLQFAFVFALAAALAWACGGSLWLVLHFFLAGGLVLAISAVSMMLTVTWASAPAPRDAAVWTQRLAIAVGVVAVTVGRERGASTLMATGGLLVAFGIVLLAAMLVLTVRQGIQRRFDAAVVAYACALTAGAVGVVLGVVMALDTPRPRLRSAHMTINLLGLVGIVIGGTLPYFAATVGRSKMATWATPRRLVSIAVWQSVAVAAAVTGIGTDVGWLAVVGLVAYACGIVAVLWHVPRPTQRQWRWAGPRLYGLWLGAAWWCAAVLVAASHVARHVAPFEERWVAVLAVAGYGQILWGSLAYLLPVLRAGGHELLTKNFALTRSWVGFVGVNVTGIALVADWRRLAVVSCAIWLIDSTARIALVRFGARAVDPS